MSYFKYLRALGVAAGLTAAACTTNAQEIKKVFVIAMENHNWTQPAKPVHRGHPADLFEPERAIHQQPGEWNRDGGD